MSYILDALKRADSERERGLVPGLHAQPVPVETPAPGAYRVVKPLILVVASAALVLLGVMLWRWLGPDTGPVPVQVSAAPVVRPAGTTAPVAAPSVASPAPEKPAVPIAATPVMPAPEAARPAAPEPAQAPRMVMAPAQITPAPSAATNTSRDRSPDRGESETRSTSPRGLPPPAQSANPQAMQATQGATPAPVAPAARVAPLAELPADVRLAMPKLVISGATYADNPAYRMLIINGQVFHEGEKLANDLLLEQIGPKSAVLSFKGQRYSLAY